MMTKLPHADALLCSKLLEKLDEFAMTIPKVAKQAKGDFDKIDNVSESDRRAIIRYYLKNDAKVIEKLIKQDKDLSGYEVEVLRSWAGCERQTYFLMEKRADGATFILLNLEDEDLEHSMPFCFVAKGLLEDIDTVVPGELPLFVQTSLLPYGDMIFWDGVVVVLPLEFPEGFADSLREMYAELVRRNMVMEQLIDPADILLAQFTELLQEAMEKDSSTQSF